MVVAPEVLVEPDVDCDGRWLACDSSCKKHYEITIVASGDGADCPHTWNEEAVCASSEGDCVVGIGGAMHVSVTTATAFMFVAVALAQVLAAS